MVEKTHVRTIPTVRVKAGTKDGFALINVSDFNHEVHELFDQKDGHLVPSPEENEQAADIGALRKKVAAAEDRAMEAESERDEWKARAEAAEGKLATR